MNEHQAEHAEPQDADDDLALDGETVKDLDAQEPDASDIHGGAALTSAKVWCSDAGLKRDVVRLTGSLARLRAIV